MKRIAFRPGVFQITCLLVSYLIACQQQILIEQANGAARRDLLLACNQSSAPQKAI
jgi:hypothetical protein